MPLKRPFRWIYIFGRLKFHSIAYSRNRMILRLWRFVYRLCSKAKHFFRTNPFPTIRYGLDLYQRLRSKVAVKAHHSSLYQVTTRENNLNNTFSMSFPFWHCGSTRQMKYYRTSAASNASFSSATAKRSVKTMIGNIVPPPPRDTHPIRGHGLPPPRA